MNSGEVSLSADPRPSTTVRIILSVAIVGYLFLVVLGPLSNPIASEHLTAPLARKLGPFHQALFLGHGYRFFGPDPGPSHIVEYEISKAGAEPIAGHFPDRDGCWPRLRYHRWFMLSETIFNEAIGVLDAEQQRQMFDELAAEIESARLSNQQLAMQSLVAERDRLKQSQKFQHQRLQMLVRSLADYLLEKHQGDSVEIFLRERLIPRPIDVQSRIPLSAPRFLSERRSLGKFSADLELEEIR